MFFPKRALKEPQNTKGPLQGLLFKGFMKIGPNGPCFGSYS